MALRETVFDRSNPAADPSYTEGATPRKPRRHDPMIACIDGVITLDHDPVAGTLFHTFESFNGALSAEGTLTPGEDPGPPPSGGTPEDD